MKKRTLQSNIFKAVFSTALLLFTFNNTVTAQLTTTRKGNYGNMTYLVNNILLSGGLTAVAGSVTYTTGAPDTSWGFFNGIKSNIGMDSGIIITNGGIGLASGPNKKTSDQGNRLWTTYGYGVTNGGNGGWPNSNLYQDSDLANLIGLAVSKTYSCGVLQFDFIAISDSVEFQYSFGSNEEPYYVGSSYVDDFGFFLSGPGINGPGGKTGPFSHKAENLALIPGTTTPVYINSVNCSTNSAYYVCNWPSSTGCSSCPASTAVTTVGYNGFTTVLTAKAKVQCGQKYHIKLGVADIENGYFDSGVFLKAGSFVPTTAPLLVSSPVSTCANTPVTLTANNGISYTWSPAGSLSANTGASVTATPTVTTTYTVIGNMPGGCIDTGKITVTVPANPTLSVTPSAPAICAGGSVNMTASGASTYVWTPNTNLSCTACASTMANPATTTKYYVTGTAADGCISEDSATVTVSAILPVTATSASPTVCSNDSVLLSANGASTFTWSPSTGLACSTCASTEAAAGNITYIVTGTSSGCSNSAPVTISSIPSPTVGVTATASGNTVCSGTSTSLNATGANTYTWSPNTAISSTTGSPVTVTPTAPTNYIVTGTASNGCTDTASITIGINPVPTVTITGSVPPLFCSGTTDTLNASGASTYIWSPAAQLNTTSGSQVYTTPSTTTTYQVIGTNSFGCNDTVPLTINVITTPTINVAPLSPGICPGDSVLLVATGATTYNWSPTVGLDSISVDSMEAKPASTSTYTITGTAGGCTSLPDSVTITVGALKIIATAVSDTLCSGNSTGMNAIGAVTYVWNPGTTLNDSITAAVTATPTVTTTYTVTGTSGVGCSADTTITITVNTTPTVALTADSGLICFGTGGTLVTASGATTYNWSPASSVTCSTCDSTNANPNSTTIYTVTGTSIAGCTSKQDTMTISVDHPIIMATAVSPAICNGLTTTINATGGVTYVWSPASSLSSSTGSSVVTSTLVDTTYKVVGIDALGCTDSGYASITVNANPVVTATATDSSICSGNPTQLNGSGASGYSWSPSSVSCSTCPSTPANPLTSTTYTLVGTNGNGCTDTAYVPIIVNISPTINIIPSGNDTLCPKSTVTIIASGGTTYIWTPSTGLNQTTGSSVIASTPNPGPIQYKVIGSNGVCTDSAVANIYSYPPFTVSMSPDSICLGQTATVSMGASGGKSGYIYNWTNAIPALPNGPGPYIVNPDVPTYYVCSVTDGCGTTETDSMMVYTRPVPNASFVATPNSILGGEYVSFVNTSTGATSYFWNMGNGYSTVDSFPYYQYEMPGTYIVYLVASNQFGCRDTAWDTLHVIDSIYIPNVFTPNGDGQNDVFHVTMGGMKTYNIEIFNRWGERVFEADSPYIDWTGRSMSGVEESDGIYYYIIKATDYSNKNHNYNGYLQLIR